MNNFISCFFFIFKKLIGVRQINKISDSLKNFLPFDKFYKSNLLMPYGIFIDAFIIAGKNGDIKALEDFFNKESSEFEPDPELYNKFVALKILLF
jgi:hypothetical protein